MWQKVDGKLKVFKTQTVIQLIYKRTDNERTEIGGNSMDHLTAEERYKIYLEVRREKERDWRRNKQSAESKAKKRDYMRDYMKRYRADK